MSSSKNQSTQQIIADREATLQAQEQQVQAAQQKVEKLEKEYAEAKRVLRIGRAQLGMAKDHVKLQYELGMITAEELKEKEKGLDFALAETKAVLDDDGVGNQ